MDLRQDRGRVELGRRIQTAIVQAGYSSLPAFAEQLGCSRALIYQYVSGDVLVQLDRLCAIAELTDRPLEWFIVADPNGASAKVAQLEQRVEDLREECDSLQEALAAERGRRLEETQDVRRSLLAALLELCGARREAGDLHGLDRSAARACDLARSLGDTPALMRAHIQAGHAAFGLGERDSAEESLGAALALADELGDARAEMSARQELLRVLQAAGRLNEAREQGRVLAQSDAWWPRWAAPVALAALEEQAGNLSEAERLLDEAEAVVSSPDAPSDHVGTARAYVQSNRVNVALARGRYMEARQVAERLHDLAAEAGLADQVREATLNRAIVALRVGELEDAQHLLGSLREWAEMAGDRRLAGLSAVFEAERLLESGDPAAARRLAMDAIEMGNGLVSGQIVAEAELVLGMACRAEDLTGDALYHLQRCRKRASRLKLRRVEVAAQLQEGRALLAAGEEGAEAVLEEARTAAQQEQYADLADEADRILDG